MLENNKHNHLPSLLGDWEDDGFLRSQSYSDEVSEPFVERVEPFSRQGQVHTAFVHSTGISAVPSHEFLRKQVDFTGHIGKALEQYVIWSGDPENRPVPSGLEKKRRQSSANPSKVSKQIFERLSFLREEALLDEEPFHEQSAENLQTFISVRLLPAPNIVLCVSGNLRAIWSNWKFSIEMEFEDDDRASTVISMFTIRQSPGRYVILDKTDIIAARFVDLFSEIRS